jgi:hypothetical protein
MLLPLAMLPSQLLLLGACCSFPGHAAPPRGMLLALGMLLPLACCSLSGHAACPGNAALLGMLLPLVWCCPPGMLLPLCMLFPLGIMLPPLPRACRSTMGMLLSQKNINWRFAPMDHNFVTERFFLWEVFIHLALNFVTLFQKYF